MSSSSSSAFPILNKRPIDKWKVTELKEELKRRRLTTQGFKLDLVRRLDHHSLLSHHQQESERLNAAALAPPANQQPVVIHVPGGYVAPDPVQTTPLTGHTLLKSHVESENKETFCGLDPKAQPTEAVLEKCATHYQGNQIADNVKLEHSVNKSQEPSTVIGESHPMDVEKPPLEQKISVGSGDAANADMTKGNNNKCNNCSQLSEKLNLDRSSGDESIMDDEPETKPTQSVTSHQVSEKNDLLPENPDIMDLGKGEAPDNKSPHPLVVSDKRKLPVNDQDAVGKNEPAKRQRRWNSGTINVPEAQELLPILLFGAYHSLRIDRFLRPFTLKAVQELLGKTGNVTSFWMDTIKTHCYVSYGSVEEAAATREAVYNLQWPPNGGRLLTAEFVGPEEVKAKLEAPQSQTQAPSQPPPTALPPPPPLTKAPPVKERHVLPFSSSSSCKSLP
ncbi:SAP domain-containing protein [Raphanus sativus]|nr:SAP domain-containing protein [Raphanus sativus]